MGVFGTLAGANLGENIQKSFADALRKKLEDERRLKQEIERMRLQYSLQGDMQRDLTERQFAFNQISRLIEAGNIEGARGFAKQYAPYLLPAVEAASAGAKRQRDVDYLRQNWQDMVQYITDPNDAQRFTEAMRTDNVDEAMAIAIKHRVPFAQVALEKGQAEVRAAKTEADVLENRLKFLEDTYGFRVDQEALKAEGLDLNNQRTRQIISQESQRFANEMERWGIENRILQADAEGKELSNRLLAARVKVAEATTEEEIKKARLEIQDLEQRLLERAIDIQTKELNQQLLKGQVDEFFQTKGLRLAAAVEELARRSPEAARSWVDKNGAILEAGGLKKEDMNAMIAAYERLKKFEDPTRANALDAVDVALKTPPRDQKEAETRLKDIEGVLNEAVKQGAMTEDEKNFYLSAVQSAWNGAIDALGMKMLELQLEMDKLRQDAGVEAWKQQKELLQLRIQALGKRLTAAQQERQIIKEKLIANQCQTELIQLAGQGFAVTTAAKAGSEVCRQLAQQYARADAIVAETDMNLRAIDLQLGGLELNKPEAKAGNTPADVVRNLVARLKTEGKKLTPAEARAELTALLPNMPDSAIDAFIEAMKEDGVVEDAKQGGTFNDAMKVAQSALRPTFGGVGIGIPDR